MGVMWSCVRFGVVGDGIVGGVVGRGDCKGYDLPVRDSYVVIHTLMTLLVFYVHCGILLVEQCGSVMAMFLCVVV